MSKRLTRTIVWPALLALGVTAAAVRDGSTAAAENGGQAKGAAMEAPALARLIDRQIEYGLDEAKTRPARSPMTPSSSAGSRSTSRA